MASAATNPSASTQPGSIWALTRHEGDDSLLFATKRPRRENKLEELEAHLKTKFGHSMENTEGAIELVKDKQVADEAALKVCLVRCERSLTI
jgi:hypothetical protein